MASLHLRLQLIACAVLGITRPWCLVSIGFLPSSRPILRRVWASVLLCKLSRVCLGVLPLLSVEFSFAFDVKILFSVLCNSKERYVVRDL